jgi:hypothetical protein
MTRCVGGLEFTRASNLRRGANAGTTGLMARKSGRDDDDDSGEEKPAESKSDEPTKPGEEAPTTKRPTQELPAIAPPPPKGEPWPDATPTPMKPVEPGPDVKTEPDTRARTKTVAMGVDSIVGKPPEMPRVTAPPPLALGHQVENPTHMPGPRDVPAGNTDDPAPAPGRVPAGDSRSMRRGSEFALIYRVGSSVISRSGIVGTRGQWRVVEYPTSAAASHGYAKECSRFVAEGFTDYRDD